MDKRTYKISMIVPVYNVKEYLPRCVESLTVQSWEDMEILLIDDGSTDGSGSLCDELAKKDGRIKVVHKENGGLVSAWKRGVREASGDYVSFVDSDDWVDETMLAEMGAHLSGSSKEIISGDYVIERDNGTRQYVWQQLAPGEYTGARLETEVIPNLLGKEARYVCISRCMKLISRQLVLDNMHYSDPVIRLGEDTTIMLPALLDCERLVIMDHKAYYHYLYVESSMIHRYDRGLYENIGRLKPIMHRIIEDKFGEGAQTPARKGTESTVPQKQGTEAERGAAAEQRRNAEQRAQMHKKAEQEYVYLLLLALKNEARGNPAGYRKNIAAICRDSQVKRLVEENPVTVEERSNKLLYAVLKHPNGVMIRLLRLAMIVYYAKK